MANPSIAPRFDWTREELLTFVSGNDLPISPLHAQGFASIGCAPCTRAITPGEPERDIDIAETDRLRHHVLPAQSLDQLRLLSTSARCLIQGIMSRSFAPTCSA